nr:restriction endonuclease [Lysinibacillus sphaericus]
MGLPRYDEIHLPLLKLIMENQIHNLKQAEEILSIEFGLTNEDLNERVPSGGRKFYSQVSFSKMLLVKAGLVFKKRTPFRATDKARNLVEQNPKKITKRYLIELAEEKYGAKIQKDNIEEEELKLESFDEYLRQLKTLNETYFEKISGLVLAKVYNIDFSSCVEITPPMNDGGVDGIIRLIEDHKVYFEAKIRSRPIGVKLLREFVGGIEGYDGKVGYFVTTSTAFTTPAVKYVNNLKNKDIKLINGYELVKLIFKYNLENEIIIR